MDSKKDDELIIVQEDNLHVIATLDKDGEFHEVSYGYIPYKDFDSLVKTLEVECGIEATVIKVTR